jgi:hypothetical protein
VLLLELLEPGEERARAGTTDLERPRASGASGGLGPSGLEDLDRQDALGDRAEDSRPGGVGRQRRARQPRSEQR